MIYHIDTFCHGHNFGSRQNLYVFENSSSALEAALSYAVQDEYDHSFVHIGNTRSSIFSKNKKGAIQFCGSAAYALAWILYYEYGVHSNSIFTSSQEIKMFAHKGDVCVSFPSQELDYLHVREDHQLYYCRKLGIYVAQFHSSDLPGIGWVESLVDRESLQDVGAVCIFFWDKNRDHGFLRYFTPWHGRDEDYVTGSIHQCLTRLVSDLYINDSIQTWSQLSSSPGRLCSYHDSRTITLYGQCRIV